MRGSRPRLSHQFLRCSSLAVVFCMLAGQPTLRSTCKRKYLPPPSIYLQTPMASLNITYIHDRLPSELRGRKEPGGQNPFSLIKSPVREGLPSYVNERRNGVGSTRTSLPHCSADVHSCCSKTYGASPELDSPSFEAFINRTFIFI